MYFYLLNIWFAFLLKVEKFTSRFFRVHATELSASTILIMNRISALNFNKIIFYFILCTGILFIVLQLRRRDFKICFYNLYKWNCLRVFRFEARVEKNIPEMLTNIRKCHLRPPIIFYSTRTHQIFTLNNFLRHYVVRKLLSL